MSLTAKAVTAVALTIASTMVPSSASVQPEDLALYAYSTPDSVVVMRGDAVIGSWHGKYTARYRGMQWTTDGRFLAFIADKTSADGNDAIRQLISIDAASGAVRYRLCEDCGSMAPSGGSTVLVTQTDGDSLQGFYRYDLDDPRPPVALPNIAPPMRHVSLFAGGFGEILLQGVNEYGTEIYQKITSSGAGREVGTWNNRHGDWLRGLGPSAVTLDGDGNSVYAVIGYFEPKTQSCSGYSEVFFAIPGRQAMVGTNINAMEPPPRLGFDSVLLVRNVWWGQDGLLHAAVLSALCDGTPSHAPQTGEWVLDRGTWRQISHEVISDELLLPRGVTVLGVDEKAVADGDTVYLRDGVKSTRIADGVVDIAAPPLIRTELASRHPNVLTTLCGDKDVECHRDLYGKAQLATAHADLDGDGKPDTITVTEEWPNKSVNGISTVTVTLATGRIATQVLPDAVIATQPPSIYVTDLNGDHRPDLVLVSTAAVHSTAVVPLTLSDSKLMPLTAGSDTLWLDDTPHQSEGVQCLPDGRVVVTEAHLGSLDANGLALTYVVDTNTYGPGSAGTLGLSATTTSTEPADAGGLIPPDVEALAGLHCTGIPRFPQ